MKKLTLLAMAFTCLFFVSCSEDDNVTETSLPGELSFTINNTFGSSALTLDTEYTTSEGDKIKPNQFRYWVSNIKLKKADGSTYAVPDAYYLLEDCKEQVIENSDGIVMPASKRETVSIMGVPAGEYTEVTFSIGVDSEYNDNLSLQAGELSILQNMTADNGWMWFTSYIFTKVGGTYTNANSETFNFLFETGSNDHYKTITKAFTSPVEINGLKPAEIKIKADASKLFTGISIEDASLNDGLYRIGASTPELMAKLATNYTTVFELVSIENVAQ
jgi:hypothetical protein